MFHPLAEISVFIALLAWECSRIVEL